MAMGGNEEKVCQLLVVIKWKATERAMKPLSVLELTHHKPSTASEHELKQKQLEPCTAKGAGLIAGVIGKMCKFNIFINSQDPVQLNVNIKGPGNEGCNEKIVSFEHDRRPSVLAQQAGQLTGGIWSLGAKSVRFWQQSNGMPIIRECSVDVDENGEQPNKIPFDYQCVSAGHLVITYIPRSAGPHTVNILWHDTGIRGSPFTVQIAESIEKLSEQTKGKMQQKKVSIDTRPLYYTDKTAENMQDMKDISDFVKQQLLASIRDKRQKSQEAATRLKKQATITRRRVLRRVVTKAGQEIVIHEATASPSSSKREKKNSLLAKSELTRRGSPAPMKEPLSPQNFDFDYDSDVSTLPSTRAVTPELNNETDYHKYIMQAAVVNSVTHTDSVKSDDTTSSFMEGTSATTSDSPTRNELQRKDSVKPPLFDENFKAGTFFNANENIIIKPTPIRVSPTGVEIPDKTADSSVPQGSNSPTQQIVNTGLTAENNFLHVPLNGNIKNGSLPRPVSPFDRRDDESETSDTDSGYSKNGSSDTNFNRDGRQMRAVSPFTIPPILSDKHVKYSGSFDLPSQSLDATGPALRFLQSDSLSKSCYFISHSAITDSMSNNLSPVTADDKQANACIKEQSREKLKHSLSLPNYQTDDTSPFVANPKGCHDALEKVTMKSVITSSTEKDTGINLNSPPAILSSGSPQSKSPYHSPTSGSANTSRRGSLVRQEVVLQKLSEESSDSDLNRKLGECDKESSLSQGSESFGEDNDLQAWQSVAREQRDTIISPKAKTDRVTQVSYEEIKRETGYVRPTIFVRHRRRMIKVEPEKTETDKVQNISSHTDESPKSAKQTCTLQASLTPFGLSEETSDSGIVDDLNTTSSANPIAAQIPVSPREPLGLVFLRPQPRFVDGHRIVSRPRFRHIVSIDSLLLKGNSPHASREEKTNTNSKEKLSRDGLKNSKSEEKNKVTNARFSVYGTRRRRVWFSRRVLMYRRSSSRSSRTSVTRKQTTVSSMSSGGETQQNLDDCYSILPSLSAENHPSLESEASFDERKELMPPPIVDNVLKSTSLSSTDDGYTGFGVTKTQGRDFLSALDVLSSISPLTETPGNRKAAILSDITNKPKRPNTLPINPCVKSENLITFTPESVPEKETDEMNGYDNPYFEEEKLDVTQTLQEIDEILESSYEPGSLFECQALPRFSAPASAQCVAYGVGLTTGHVNIKNNFQVSLHKHGVIYFVSNNFP